MYNIPQAAFDDALKETEVESEEDEEEKEIEREEEMETEGNLIDMEKEFVPADTDDESENEVY